MPSPHSLKALLKSHTSSDQQDAHSNTTFKDNNSNVDLINATSTATEAGTKSTTKPQGESSRSQSQGKASDQLLEPSTRKRSMLLNMVLPPEAPPVDAKLAIPPVILFPPALEPEGSVVVRDREIPAVNTTHKSTRESVVAAAAAQVETSTSSSSSSTTTAWSLRSLVWGSQEAGAEQTITRRSKVDQKHNGDNVKGIVKSQEIADSETTTVVSKTTQIRTWISKMSRSEESEKPSAVSQGLVEMSKGMLQAQQQQQEQQQIIQPNQPTEGSVATTTTTTTTVQHQEIHHKTRSVALVSVNVSVQDIFGLGKVMEMILALFHAHGAFLRRQPFWLQCALLGWEALVILLLVWGVLRVVGLAEVIVWGADDLVRGTISTLQTVGRTMLAYLSPQ